MNNEIHPDPEGPEGSEAEPVLANESHASPETPETANGSEMQAMFDELKNQLQEKDNKYRYLYAEFENYKKRVLKERSDLQKFGWEGVARELLQVADNLDRALKAANPETTDKVFIEGIEMVLRQFHTTLEKWGVKSIETEKQAFDPHLHEAIAQAPSAEHPEGQIMQETTKGYTLHGRLLRPAKVVVSAGQGPKS